MQSEEFNTGIIKTNHSANDVAAAYPSIDDKDPTEIIVGNNSQPVKMGYETFIENVEENAIPKPFNSLTSLMNSANNTPFSQLNTVKDFKAAELIPKQIETDKKGFYEKTTADLTRVGAIMGTPIYMSPEQCRAERPGTSSDIYSLGVIAYQMLSGKTPFEGESISIITGHLQFAPPPSQARKIPRKVKRVIHNALSKEPMTRPPTAEIFASQLRSYSENIISIFRRKMFEKSDRSCLFEGLADKT